jgi:hypothetical protein
VTYRRLPPPSHDPGIARGTTSYHRSRAEEERAAAGSSSCMVRDVHLELAELHDLQAEGAVRDSHEPG